MYQERNPDSYSDSLAIESIRDDSSMID